jgi:hypothetical protein
VLFACERIPAMGAPVASVDLLHETLEIAAVTYTTASRGDIFGVNFPASSGMECDGLR